MDDEKARELLAGKTNNLDLQLIIDQASEPLKIQAAEKLLVHRRPTSRELACIISGVPEPYKARAWVKLKRRPVGIVPSGRIDPGYSNMIQIVPGHSAYVPDPYYGHAAERILDQNRFSDPVYSLAQYGRKPYSARAWEKLFSMEKITSCLEDYIYNGSLARPHFLRSISILIQKDPNFHNLNQLTHYLTGEERIRAEALLEQKKKER